MPKVQCRCCDKWMMSAQCVRIARPELLQMYSFLRGANNNTFRLLTIHDNVCKFCRLLVSKRCGQSSTEVGDDSLQEGIGTEVNELEQNPTVSNVSPFFKFESMSEEHLHTCIGLSRAHFLSLATFVTCVRETSHTNVEKLGMFLMKLRHDMSNDLLAVLFVYESRQGVAHNLAVVRDVLSSTFVPQYLGFANLSRAEILNHVPHHTQLLYGVPTTTVVLVFDGTYLYTEKSNNYKIQRRYFSVQKGRPLVKPFMIVTPDGFIVDVIGPYVGANNDASITKDLFQKDIISIQNVLSDGDVILVDRGFRDVMELLTDLGYTPKMPHLLKDGNTQYSVTEANESRMVTKFRWVVESKNGHIKTKYKAFAHTIPISRLLTIDKDLRIVCALENTFGTPLLTDTEARFQEINNMLQRLSKHNDVLDRLEKEKLLTKRITKEWTKISLGEHINFPEFSVHELREITCGIYQIMNAKSYTAEHVKDDGIYELFVLKSDDDLLRFKMQSRHVSSKVYHIFIQKGSGEIGDKVHGYYCTCPNGSRTLGCCSHTASVLWYLGIGQYEQLKHPAGYLENLFLDTKESPLLID